MKVTPITPNRTEVELSDGTCILFSYSTPVAALVPGRGWIRTSTKHSPTTTRHINRWLFDNLGRNHCVPFVTQEEMNKLVNI